MTARELLTGLGRYPVPLAVLLLAPLVAAGILGLVVSPARAGRSWVRYLYALLVYWTAVPGMLAAVVTAYVLFLTRESLLDLSLAVWALPLAAMVVTLALVTRNVDLKLVPGFDRLSGLLVALGLSFGIVLAIAKTHIWLVFGGSMAMFFALAAFVFALLQWGARVALRRHGDALPERPRFPQV